MLRLVVLFGRFSHSPLIDEDEEEDEAKEPMLNEAFGEKYQTMTFTITSKQG